MVLTADKPLVVRYMGGITPPLCQSCETNPACLSVAYPDLIIVVCYGCRP